jgi:hypothetical protein
MTLHCNAFLGFKRYVTATHANGYKSIFVGSWKRKKEASILMNSKTAITFSALVIAVASLFASDPIFGNHEALAVNVSGGHVSHFPRYDIHMGKHFPRYDIHMGKHFPRYDIHMGKHFPRYDIHR